MIACTLGRKALFLGMMGVVMVAAASALAVSKTARCSGSCAQAATCSTSVAWCCCRAAAGLPFTCVCSGDLNCTTTSVPGTWFTCVEGGVQ